MEMFFLSYVNELHICLGICLSSSWFCLRLKPWKDNGSTNQYVLLTEMFSQAMFMKLCICLEICLSLRFMSIFIWMTHLVPMAPHSSTLAWKIPWTEEPGGLQSMGSRRVGHDWVTSLSLFTCMRWRRKWQPTPVFLPGESQGWGSLVGCRLWGRTESDTTEAT